MRTKQNQVFIVFNSIRETLKINNYVRLQMNNRVANLYIDIE